MTQSGGPVSSKRTRESDPLDAAPSLRRELLGSLGLVLVLAVVVLSFAAEFMGRRRHRDLEVDRIAEHASDLASLAGLRGDTSPAALDDLAQQALGSSRSTIAVEIFALEADGPQLRASAGIPPRDVEPPTLSARRHTDAIGVAGQVTVDEPMANPAPDEAPLVLRLTAEVSAWTRVADWPTILIVAFGVALISTALGAWLIELRILRPLRQIDAGVRRVASGRFDEGVQLESARELRELGAGVNEMMAALGRQRDTLATQRKKLQRSEHMAAVGRLSAGVAHEVGNPLAALLGYVEFLLDPRQEPSLSEEQRGLLERVRRQTERIQDIVGQLLDYSRERPQRLESAALLPTVEECIALLQVDPACRGVRIEVVGERETEAYFDAQLLSQVLLNLGLNAVHASRDPAARGESEPRVQFALGRDRDGPFCEVRDSGPGVDEATRSQIFEPFFTTREAGKGTGLGLAISRGLVESMDGQLDCTREGSLLGGACFVVRLADAPPPELSVPGLPLPDAP